MSVRLTDQQRRDREMSESELRDQANDVAEIYGYVWMWVGPLRTSHGWVTATRGPLGKGWVDTFYVRPRDGRLIFAEFKKELGKVTPEQGEVHRILRMAGLEVHVIRPSDFDRFIEILRS